jgi:hypothetical protein
VDLPAGSLFGAPAASFRDPSGRMPLPHHCSPLLNGGNFTDGFR